jgi:hypothetical protein
MPVVLVATVRLHALFGSIDEQNIHPIQEYRDKHCHFSAGKFCIKSKIKLTMLLLCILSVLFYITIYPMAIAKF